MEGLCGHGGALAALQLLQHYNHLLLPPDLTGGLRSGGLTGGLQLQAAPVLPPPAYLPPFCAHPHTVISGCVSPSDSAGGGGVGAEARRRGEKRPIPPDQKDEKYFERRKRNNQAAKKSRDARKIREDQIAWRACVLEHENASLRAHVAALKQETITLRKLLLSADERLRPHHHAHHAHAPPPPHAQPASSTTAD